MECPPIVRVYCSSAEAMVEDFRSDQGPPSLPDSSVIDIVIPDSQENVQSSDAGHRSVGRGEQEQEAEETSSWKNLVFHTHHEARQWYKDYAHGKGFAVRVDYSKWVVKKGIVRWMKYVCNKEGHRKKNIPSNIKKRSRRCQERTDCKALIFLKYDKNACVYRITKWNLEHNHELVPKKYAYMLRSNRKVSEVQTVVVEHNEATGIALQSSYEVMSLVAGGVEAVGFLRSIRAILRIGFVRRPRIVVGTSSTGPLRSRTTLAAARSSSDVQGSPERGWNLVGTGSGLSSNTFRARISKLSGARIWSG